MKVVTKVERHKELCDKLNSIYEQKNTAYGDSFGDTFQRLGLISAVTRISDKYNRLANLATHPEVNQGDESIQDTLMDMANYCIMTVMEMELAKQKGNPVDSFRDWVIAYNSMRTKKERIEDATRGCQA